MKVKVTATITLETEIFPENYDPPKTDDEIMAWETQKALDEPWDSSLSERLCGDGELSNFKIEKVDEDQAEAA